MTSAIPFDIQNFEAFIAQYPVFEYQIIHTYELNFQSRVRIICKQECERYGKTWACPPAVGSLETCKETCLSYSQGLFFSTVAEVSDVLCMEEGLATRKEHEKITQEIGDYLSKQDLEVLILSTESCDICAKCTYPDAPCRHPDKMHPCLESHGIVVSDLVEKHQMTYQLGGNTLLWFSLVLFRKKVHK